MKVDKSDWANPKLITQGTDNQVNTIVSFEDGDVEVKEKSLHRDLAGIQRFTPGLATDRNEFSPILKAYQDGRLGPADESYSGEQDHLGNVARTLAMDHQELKGADNSPEANHLDDRSIHPDFVVEKDRHGWQRATKLGLENNPITGEEREDGYRLPENRDHLGIQVDKNPDYPPNNSLYAYAVTKGSGSEPDQVETVNILRTRANEIVVQTTHGELGDEGDYSKSFGLSGDPVTGETKEWRLPEAEAFAITAGMPETYRK